MSNIQVKGTQKFMGKEIPVVEGGFGEGKRCLSDKTIAEIHGVRNADIRRRITDNIRRFKEGIDYIDLKSTVHETHSKNILESLTYTDVAIRNAVHIYLLSERGYAKLIKIMDTDLAWNVHDKLMDEYFTMREIINSNERLKASLLLSIYNGGQDGILASKKLSEIEIKEATKPLLDKIEEDKPKVTFAERVMKSGDNILVRELAKIASDEGFTIGERRLYTQLREWGYICKNSTEPTQRAMDQKYFVVKVGTINTPYGIKEIKTTRVTPKGQIKIVERLLEKINKLN